jgi:putative ABC transport system permease protein
MLQDFQHAWRLFVRSPGFSLVAIATLTVGIGVNTAVFSALEAVILKPPAYRDPSCLVVLSRFDKKKNQVVDQIAVPDWRDWQRSRAIASLAVYVNETVTVTGGAQIRRFTTTDISANLPATLGVVPLLGRSFEGEDTQPKAPLTVLLSERLWRNRFGSDPRVLGQTLPIQDRPARIIGVMPSSFAFPTSETEFWLPLQIDPKEYQRRNVYYLQTVGRLKMGVTIAAARAELARVADAVAREFPESMAHIGVDVKSLQDSLIGNSRALLVALSAAVGLTLLLVCVNLSNLLLARAAARSSEFAIRVALGASRGQLVRQLLAEGLLLSTLGGLSGVLAAFWGLDAIRSMAAERFSRASAIRIDGEVLLFDVAVTFLSGLLFGLAPVWAATRERLRAVSSRVTRGGGNVRAVLVIAEVTMAFVLLSGAGLLVRSLWSLSHVNPGFAKDHVLTFVVYPHMGRFQTRAELAGFYEGLLQNIKRIPGVHAAGTVALVPLAGGKSGTEITVENRLRRPGESIEPNYQLAGPGYFGAMEIPLIEGREFDRQDLRREPDTVIVNKALADLCWPGQDPLGRRIHLGPDPKDPWSTVVGVVGNVRHDQLDLPARPEVYENYFQHAWDSMSLVVRYDSNADEVAAVVRAQIKAADNEIAVPAAVALDQVVSTSLRDRLFLMWMLLAFGGCAMVLTVIGVYGVVAYSVSQRTREIGIRIAVGAERRNITHLVLRGGIRMAGAGVVLGGLAALAVNRLFASLLFGVRPSDPTTLLAVAVVLPGVTLLACLLPAIRASRVELVVVLRQE